MKIQCGSQSSANGIDSMENWLISKTTSNFWPYYVFLPMWFKIKEFQGTLLGSEFYLTLDITSIAIFRAIWYVSLESPQGTAAWRTNTGEDTVNQDGAILFHHHRHISIDLYIILEKNPVKIQYIGPSAPLTLVYFGRKFKTRYIWYIWYNRTKN